MKIINKSKNTIYIDDVDFYLKYRDEEPENIDTEIIKKSKTLRNFILSPLIDIYSYNNKERIEASLAYLKKKSNSQVIKNEQTLQQEIEQEVIPVKDIEVKLHGMFYDAGGYAKVNRNVALKLNQAGIKLQIIPKRSENQLNEDEINPLKTLSNNKVSKDAILIDSIIPSFAEFTQGKYKILYTTIESYSVPNQFIESCKLYDEIWITSPWSKEILQKYVKDKPIYVMPAGIDHNLYAENGPKYDLGSQVKNFIFISVFGWGYRKGYDVLLKSYFDEFNSNDDVSLLLATRYQTGTSRSHKEKVKNDIEQLMTLFPNKDLPHVVRYGKVTPEKDMPKLYRAANAFILPTRAEGSNLCAPEASLCGLPVIMTNCSGQQMYLRNDNAYLIDIDRIEKLEQGKMHIHYWDNQEFPSLTSDSVINQTKKHMRTVYENYSEAKNRNKKLQNLILNNFTWDKTIAKILLRLKEIKSKF